MQSTNEETPSAGGALQGVVRLQHIEKCRLPAGQLFTVIVSGTQCELTR